MRKIIFRSSIAFIVIWFLSFFIRSIDLFEFSDAKHRGTLDLVLTIGLPIAVLLTLTGTLGRRNGPGHFIGTLMLTITAAIALFIIHILLRLGVDWCHCNYSTTLYTLKSNDNIQIMTRSYGCDAMEMDFVYHEGEYKVHWYGPYLITTTPIDTASIDKSLWIPEGKMKNK